MHRKCNGERLVYSLKLWLISLIYLTGWFWLLWILGISFCGCLFLVGVTDFLVAIVIDWFWLLSFVCWLIAVSFGGRLVLVVTSWFDFLGWRVLVPRYGTQDRPGIPVNTMHLRSPDLPFHASLAINFELPS